jgi:GSCFA family
VHLFRIEPPRDIARTVKRAVRRLIAPSHIVRLTASDRANAKFAEFAKGGAITIRRQPVFSRSDVFFTMGSCFAEEIRNALTNRRIACVPRYRDIIFDPATAKVDTLPDREHMNFYNTFTVRLQIEQLLGLWQQPSDDFWTVKRTKKLRWGTTGYQDPYRRLTFAQTPQLLAVTVAEINRAMREGFEAATAFIFTFGMTEVFINRASGKVAAQKPLYGGGGGEMETTLHASTFQENLDNVLATIDLVRSRKPKAPIVLTVSPVALERTFQEGCDIVTVNTESKSILRAVLGQVSRERENIIYLPSFEFVTASGYERAYEPDRRHVLQPVVGEIIDQFFAAFFSDASDRAT